MSLCVSCGLTLSGTAQSSAPCTWCEQKSAFNKLMCDFIHRSVIPIPVATSPWWECTCMCLHPPYMERCWVCGTGRSR